LFSGADAVGGCRGVNEEREDGGGLGRAGVTVSCYHVPHVNFVLND
jgi:hypothetical protein